MSLEYELSLLAEALGKAINAIATEKDRITGMDDSARRIEARLKSLQANDAEITDVLAQKASEVANARTVIDGADARAKKIIDDAQAEANAILNKAKKDAAALVHSAGKEADDIVAKAKHSALSYEPQIATRKAELEEIIENIKTARASFAALKKAAADFAAD